MSDQSTSGTERYRIGDALAELRLLDESAAVVCLDDAWARPGRQGAFGVEYPTHDFETTAEIVDVAADGGVSVHTDTGQSGGGER